MYFKLVCIIYNTEKGNQFVSKLLLLMIHLFTIIEAVNQTQTPCLTTFSNTEKGVENTTHSEVFFTTFAVFGNVVKHCLGCLIYHSVD